MSFAVVRGSAHASQLALDQILDDVISSGGSRAAAREGVNVAELLFHCFKQSPDDIFLIEADTGRTSTKGQMLGWSVRVARALRSLCGPARRARAVCVAHNARRQTAAYYGLIFAGVVPMMLEPNASVSEISHFLKLVSPALVLCDARRLADVGAAVAASSPARVVVADDERFDEFIAKESDDVDSFKVSEATQDDVILMLPTSGSTGLPKAAMWAHRGAIAQIPTMWKFHSFPLPPPRMLQVTTAQWATHSMAMLTAPVFGAHVVVLPREATAEHIANAIKIYRPTWTLLCPAVAASLAEVAVCDDLTSLETFFITGGPFGANPEAKLRSVLPTTTHLCVGIGMTELQGFGAIPAPDDPRGSYGKVLNIIDYKLVDSSGTTVGPGEAGELYVRGRCLFTGYLRDAAATGDAMVAGDWLRTGDVFTQDREGNVTFKERKKFWFKVDGHQVAPEELERVLCGIAGVRAAVVLPAPGGPAALLQPGTSPPAPGLRDRVHAAMAESFSSYKQLRGGIAFVPALPLTATGKLDRRASAALADALLAEGELK